MENGDLRAVVRYFLPLHNPNCTYHMRLHADRRDPPLPPALHVSTLHRLGDKPGGAERGTRTGGPAKPDTCGAVYLGARAADVPDVETQEDAVSVSGDDDDAAL